MPKIYHVEKTCRSGENIYIHKAWQSIQGSHTKWRVAGINCWNSRPKLFLFLSFQFVFILAKCQFVNKFCYGWLFFNRFKSMGVTEHQHGCKYYIGLRQMSNNIMVITTQIQNKKPPGRRKPERNTAHPVTSSNQVCSQSFVYECFKILVDTKCNLLSANFFQNKNL